MGPVTGPRTVGRALLIAAVLALGPSACALHTFSLASIEEVSVAPAPPRPPAERPRVGLIYERVVTLNGEPFDRYGRPIDADPKHLQWNQRVRRRSIRRLNESHLFSYVEESPNPTNVDLIIRIRTEMDMREPPWLYDLLSRYTACGVPTLRRSLVRQDFAVLDAAVKFRFREQQQVSFQSWCSWALVPVGWLVPPFFDYEERMLVLTDRLTDHAIREAQREDAFR